MTRFPLILSLILCSFMIASCSKDAAERSKTCRITGATSSSGGTTTTYAFDYNDQGKLASIQATGSGTTRLSLFSYTGNVILISRSTNGVISNIDSIVLNNLNMIQYIKNRSVSSGYFTENVISYKGEQIASLSASSGGGPVSSTSVVYNNGNLTSSTSGASVTTYGYIAGEEFRVGDYFHFIQFSEYGALYVKNKNLINETTSGNTTSSISYAYDTDGRITGAQQVNGNSITTLGYTYDCN